MNTVMMCMSIGFILSSFFLKHFFFFFFEFLSICIL